MARFYPKARIGFLCPAASLRRARIGGLSRSIPGPLEVPDLHASQCVLPYAAIEPAEGRTETLPKGLGLDIGSHGVGIVHGEAPGLFEFLMPFKAQLASQPGSAQDVPEDLLEPGAICVDGRECSGQLKFDIRL